jgi:cytochrome c oxidase subunit II
MRGDPVVALYVCGVLALGVFALMIGSLLALHRSARPTPSVGAHGAWADLLWSLVPITMILGLAWPAIRVVFRR